MVLADTRRNDTFRPVKRGIKVSWRRSVRAAIRDTIYHVATQRRATPPAGAAYLASVCRTTSAFLSLLGGCAWTAVFVRYGPQEPDVLYVAPAHTGFKSVSFLNFFFARVQAQPLAHQVPLGTPPSEMESSHWTQDAAALAEMLQGKQSDGWHTIWTRLQQEGMAWVSRCQGEWNVIHAVDTPIVFRQLTDDGTSFHSPRPPSVGRRLYPAVGPIAVACASVRTIDLCRDTGYLYHPSPLPPLRRAQAQGVSPFGPYSLIASHVVLQHLSDGLHLDLEGGGGTLEWGGRTYPLRWLSLPHDLVPPQP